MLLITVVLFVLFLVLISIYIVGSIFGDFEDNSDTEYYVLTFFLQVVPKNKQTLMENIYQMVDKTLTVDQNLVLSAFTVTDRFGNPASLDGAVEVTSSDENVLKVTANDDGTYLVETVGVGAAQLVAKADADLSDGTKEIFGFVDLEVLSGEANKIVFNLGNVTPK